MAINTALIPTKSTITRYLCCRHRRRRRDALQDEVSDGNIEDKILGAARRTHDGFFIAPRVVGGEDAAP